MIIKENPQAIEAQCNKCLKTHKSYSGSIMNADDEFSEYLVSFDPQHCNKFFLFIKLNRQTDYIVCGLVVSLEDEMVLTYMDKFPLVVEGFNWLLEVLPRIEIIERGFDEIVFGIFKEILIPYDSRIRDKVQKWSG